MTRQFTHTGGLRPGRSVFDLSHEYKLTGDMGLLYPILAQEMVPGDKFTFGNQAIVRFTPLVAPILHEINVFVHYFFVPYRILWDDWEEFITGGKDGNSDIPLPRWNLHAESNGNVNNIPKFVGSLWDYLSYPYYNRGGGLNAFTPHDDSYPTDFKRRAYNLIWNEYYRDENLQAEVPLNNTSVLHRNWEKDYFTSSLPFQQRGVAPALPISGQTFADFKGLISYMQGGPPIDAMSISPNPGPPILTQIFATTPGPIGDPIKAWFNNNVVDFSDASTFDVADLRLVFQLQKWQERNARAGVRYVEFLKSHFGVNPRDDRLNRPEYCGGTKSRITISEVLQTSSSDTTTPQANMAGHGISASDSFAGKYYSQEFGLLMGLLSVMPRTSYQQGFNRQDMRRTRYDYYFPEFANLSEQAIENCEIRWKQGDNNWNVDVFGYQGRYDELRYVPSGVVSRMRSFSDPNDGPSFDYWHLARHFGSDVFLNSDFIKCVPSKRPFAVQNEDALIINIANLLKGVRPLPAISEPGLIDHW